MSKSNWKVLVEEYKDNLLKNPLSDFDSSFIENNLETLVTNCAGFLAFFDISIDISTLIACFDKPFLEALNTKHQEALNSPSYRP